MKRLELFRILRHHHRLYNRRHPMWEQNRVMKVVVGIVGAMVALYLIFLGITFALAANESDTYTAPELMFGIAPFILTLDFLLRFMLQQTPTQMIKPYVLLPLPRNACTDAFVLQSLLSTGNLTWMAMLVPYAIMAVVFSYGIGTTLLFLIAFYICLLLNSQWYLLVRTLINVSLRWWALPLGVYAIVFSPLYIYSGGDGLSTLCDAFAFCGDKLSSGNVMAWSVLLLMLGVAIEANRRVQQRCIKRELSRTEQTHLRHVSRMTFFNRYGITGEFLKLEAKSIMRNKNVKKTFIFANAIVLGISLLIALTDIYDTPLMNYFWCIYNFAIYGSMLLTKTMSYEGNYIECLATHRHTFASLLTAKYFFCMAMMLVPLLLMLPTIITGKCSVLQVVAVMVFSGGTVNACLLHLCLYNKQTMPLNTRFLGKGSMENNWTQVVAQLLILFLPVAFIAIGHALIGLNATYIVLIVIGLTTILTHHWWLNRLYRRFYQRRHNNIAALISTR